MGQHLSNARLFGKKSAAIVWGFLTSFGFSSAMAEKLDTTFVLDMVIDSAPCYFTKYNSAGEIIDSGIYRGDEGISRINVGYVKNQDGDTVDILHYGCDRVTKQWHFIPNLNTFFNLNLRVESKYRLEPYPFVETGYFENGMFSNFQNFDKTNYASCSYDEETHKEVTAYSDYINNSLSVGFSSDGYWSSSKFYHCLYSGYTHLEVTETTEGFKYDSLGNEKTYEIFDDGLEFASFEGSFINTYDDRSNLVSSKLIYSSNLFSYRLDADNIHDLTEYSYDSLDRRIKTVHYDSTKVGMVMVDSIVYVYGQSSLDEENLVTNCVDDFLGDNVRLYVVDRTICVDGLPSSLSVYDMVGHLVGTGSGESVRVPVQSGGVYVVTSGAHSVKVVVE